MLLFYKEIDTSEQSVAKAKQAAVHVKQAVREISAAFDLVSNSDRASAADQGSLARIYDELEAIQKRIDATAVTAPAAEASES